MVYGILGMINFAHGDVFMLAAFLSLHRPLGLPALGITSVPLALALTLCSPPHGAAPVWNWTIERVAYRPLRGSFRLAPLISAIGMSIFLQNFVQVSPGRPRQADGAADHPTSSMSSGARLRCHVLGMQIAIGHTLLVLGVFTWLVTKPRSAAPCAPASRTSRWPACSASTPTRPSASPSSSAPPWPPSPGCCSCCITARDFYIGFIAGVKAFTAAVLGGIGSLPGAVLGGLPSA